jgi:hypothetical protein
MNAGLAHIPHRAPTWSARIGELAAASAKPRPPSPQMSVPPTAPRLPALLARLIQRDRAREHAEDGLKANEFLVGD